MPEVEDRDAQDTADELYRFLAANDDVLTGPELRRLAWRLTRAGYRRPAGQVRTRDGRG